MNTPFIGGTKEAIKSSIEINENKLKYVLDHHLDREIQQEIK